MALNQVSKLKVTLVTFSEAALIEVMIQFPGSSDQGDKTIKPVSIMSSFDCSIYYIDLSEWHTPTSIFIATGANLMNSIKNVLKASKSAQELPGNLLRSHTTRATPNLNLLSPAPPTAQVYVSQTTPQKHIHMKYFGREAPTIRNLCVAVIDHPTGKSFNLAHHISRSWKKIGLQLGIELNKLESIERSRCDDEETLMSIFKLWMENAVGLPHHARYPLSWQGLNTLLEDIGKREVAKQYFEFLENMSFD